MLGSTTDGFTLLDAISKSPLHGKLPIIVLCNPNSAEMEEKIKQQRKRIEMQNTMLKVEADFLQKSNVQIIDLLGVMAEYRNQESGEYIRRIKEYTRIIVEEMMHLYPEKGLTTELINIIVSASSFHDIGKIAKCMEQRIW